MSNTCTCSKYNPASIHVKYSTYIVYLQLWLHPLNKICILNAFISAVNLHSVFPKLFVKMHLFTVLILLSCYVGYICVCVSFETPLIHNCMLHLGALKFVFLVDTMDDNKLLHVFLQNERTQICSLTVSLYMELINNYSSWVVFVH